MLSFVDKILYLENCLLQIDDNYADSFKADVAIFLGEFETQNLNLSFLKKMSSAEEISVWVNNLTSRIVLKFDEESEQLSDFISDFIENGHLR